MNSFWVILIDSNYIPDRTRDRRHIVAVACAYTPRHALYVRDCQLVPTHWKLVGSANLADPPGNPDAST